MRIVQSPDENLSVRRMQKSKQMSSLKQAGRNALNSASIIRDSISNAYSSNGMSSLQVEDIPYITAKSWCIFDVRTGQYQRGFRSNDVREMASLTKIATLITCLKLVDRFNLDPTSLYFSISENAANIRGTSARLEENEWLLMQDLFYGLMLPSGNDAAIALAENFGCLLYFESVGQTKIFNDIHSVDVTEDMYTSDYMCLFLKEMNSIKEELGLKSTNFSNPHGLPNRNTYSSACDLAKLTIHCLKNDEFKKIIVTKSYKGTAKFVQCDSKIIERQLQWENTNKLLDKGFRGVKTGITNSAGSCLSSWYVQNIDDTQKEESNLVIVVLSSLNQEQRFQDTIRLADWYHQKLKDKHYFDNNYY